MEANKRAYEFKAEIKAEREAQDKKDKAAFTKAQTEGFALKQGTSLDGF